MTAETLDNFKAYMAENYATFKIKWDGRNPFYQHPETKCLEIPFPKRAGEFAYLAATLPILPLADLNRWDGGTLAFTDWGIWNERANLAGYEMIERIRSTFGELRPFHVATVNRFRADEQLLLTNFILAALVYGWDAYYFPNHRGCFVHISHDEWCCMVTESSDDFNIFAKPLLDDPKGGCRILDNCPFGRPSADK